MPKPEPEPEPRLIPPLLFRKAQDENQARGALLYHQPVTIKMFQSFIQAVEQNDLTRKPIKRGADLVKERKRGGRGRGKRERHTDREYKGS